MSEKDEFKKRASFATMAGFCSADKKSDNEVFESFFPLIESASDDDRIYVRKAVNWALRSIGKRNPDLHVEAMKLANMILEKNTKAGNWIAKDALREFNNPNMRMSNYPRHIYG